MMRTRNSLLVILWIAIVASLVAQNGAPQLIWSQVFNFSNEDLQTCYNVVTNENDYFILSTDDYTSGGNLVQINKLTRQAGWQRHVAYNSGIRGSQLSLCYDGNPVFVDSAFVVTKAAAETGETIWQRNLYSSPVQVWTLYSTTNNIICRGDRGGLVVLDNSGQIIGQLEIVVPYLTPMGNHNVVTGNQQELYLMDGCLDGSYYNAAVRITKILLDDDFNGYQQSWQIRCQDEVFPKVSYNNGWLYVKSTVLDTLGNPTMRLRRLNPDSGQIIWTQDIGVPNEYDISGLIPNGDNVIAYGIHYPADPVIINCDADGVQTWSYVVPRPTGFQAAIYYDAIWDNNTLVLSGMASYSSQTWSHCRPLLSTVATTVANNDPTTPAIPNPELSCYPNPFRGSTNVKFNQIDNSPTTVAIYNTRGQLVRTLVNSQKMSPGEHTVAWDGKTDSGQLTAAGIYFFKIKSGHYSATRKMILMK